MIPTEGHAHEGECDGLAQRSYVADEDCDWHDNHCDAVVACGTLNQELCALQHGCEWHADDNACEAEVHCDELDQAACSASDECEWHADDNACEGQSGEGECDGLGSPRSLRSR